MKWIFLLIFFFSSLLFADEQALQSGDVILIALRCRTCEIIENEEGGDYSHSGVIIVKDSKVLVAQALGKVHLVSLEKFIGQKRKGTKVAIYRAVELETKKMNYLEIYHNLFEGLPFDSLYYWNNYDSTGTEKLYCSEFVAKYLNQFLKIKIKPSPMDFTKNWDFWFKMYVGKVPQGEPGLSPVGLAKSSELRFIDYIDR